MLLERLQQLVVSKKNIWGSCYRLFVSLGWSCNTALSSGINLKIQVTASGDHICFVFIINVNQKKKKKLRLELQNEPRPKCTGEIATPIKFFSLEWKNKQI